MGRARLPVRLRKCSFRRRRAMSGRCTAIPCWAGSGRISMRPQKRCAVVVIGPRICAEECLGDALARSVSKSREGTWDHRSCLRRFSQRVTTAGRILPCPGPPSIHGCRLSGRVERVFCLCQGISGAIVPRSTVHHRCRSHSNSTYPNRSSVSLITHAISNENPGSNR